MSWRAALVLSDTYPNQQLYRMVHQMPVWATETAERRADALDIRQHACDWGSEPAFTLFAADPGSIARCLDILPIIRERHPQLASITVIAAAGLEEIEGRMRDEGFLPDAFISEDGYVFRLPLESIPGLRTLTLDVKRCGDSDDVYDQLFDLLQTPGWHGKNMNALYDSVVTGDINGIEVPYRIVVKNAGRARGSAVGTLLTMHEAMQRWATQEGCPVEMQFP